MALVLMGLLYTPESIVATVDILTNRLTDNVKTNRRENKQSYRQPGNSRESDSSHTFLYYNQIRLCQMSMCMPLLCYAKRS